jgi:hypothetical protein
LADGRVQLAAVPPGVLMLLQSFDELLLMKRGGRIIFNGPLGTRSSDLISYFKVHCERHAAAKIPSDMLSRAEVELLQQSCMIDAAMIHRAGD